MGKTLIAAAVMANFGRWFPSGKLAFLAPTKPLVHQQVRAVRTAVGLARAECAELTGSMSQLERADAWAVARYLFLTPQTFVNDISSGACPAASIVCLVVDEAHKATGNHSYVLAVRQLAARCTAFRVVALSATPGGTAEWMQQVVSNLAIERVEARDEQSVDVVGSLKRRSIEKLLVSQTARYVAVRNAALEVYRGVLVHCRSLGLPIAADEPARVKRYQLLLLLQNFGAAPPPHMEAHVVMRAQALLGVAMMMALGVELVASHGCGSALAHFSREMEATRKAREAGGRQKMSQRLREDLWKSAAFCRLLATLQDGLGVSSRSCGSGSLDSHPKLAAARQLVERHIAEHGADTRVMLFSSLRDSVWELTAALEGAAGVRPYRFVGQATGSGGGESRRGLSQKRQREIVREFRGGAYNTLVCTSIGEEGLDIGEVDLIICYDVSPSAIRQTQRFGRTGRRSAGRVVMLVTEGVEEDVYQRSLENGQDMKRAIEKAHRIKFGTPPPSPLPRGCAAICEYKQLLPPDSEPASPPSGRVATTSKMTQKTARKRASRSKLRMPMMLPHAELIVNYVV